MKAFFTFSLIFFSSFIFAQISVYKPFPEVYGDWMVADNYAQTNYTAYSLYFTSNDTVINTKVYHKVMTSELGTQTGEHSYEYGHQIKSNEKYDFAYRNDAANKKVYILLKDSLAEMLWFDFNYTIGDTLKSDAYAYQGAKFPLVVNSIDSIKICDDYHKVFTFSDCDLSILIEGFGFCGGWNFSFMQTLGVCSYPLKNEATYGQGDCRISSKDNCNELSQREIITSVPEVSIGHLIEIYPNPASDIINVNLNPNTQQASYFIVDHLGKILQKGQISNTVQLDISALKSGFYFLQIQDSQQGFFVTKFVKN